MNIIDSFDSLKDAVAETLMRTDIDEAIPTWIRLAEQAMDRDLRTLEQNQTIRTRAETSRIQLPPDWLEAVRLQTGQGERLILASLDELANTKDESQFSRSIASDPGYAPEYSKDPIGPETGWHNGRTGAGDRLYAIEGEWLQISPDPDLTGAFDLEMTYKAQLPKLSDDRSTNWVLKKHPDAYLYGTLIHSAPYLVEDNRINVWKSLYQQVIETINVRSERARWSGGPINRRRGGVMWR